MVLPSSARPSHRKGMEPTIVESSSSELEKELEEEDSLVDSNHSDGLEIICDPTHVCFPLLDPGYAPHHTFPVVLRDYTPPPPNHVWLYLDKGNNVVAWAPSPGNILNFCIQ